MYQLSVSWLNAELDLASKKEERVAAHAAHFQRMKGLDKAFSGREGSGLLVIISYHKEAEYWLAKERSGKK